MNRPWTINPPSTATDGVNFNVFRHAFHDVTLVLGVDGNWSGYTSISCASDGLQGEFLTEKDLPQTMAAKLAKALIKPEKLETVLADLEEPLETKTDYCNRMGFDM